MVGLGGLPGGFVGSLGGGVWRECTVVSWTISRPTGCDELFRWVLTDPVAGAGGLAPLGDLPEGCGAGCEGISDDGTAIVGDANRVGLGTDAVRARLATGGGFPAHRVTWSRSR